MADDLEQQINTAIGGREIEACHALFLQTGNVIHVWQAYRLARSWHLDVPEWVLDVFDTWATTLTVSEHTSAKDIADALGLGTRGGPLVTRQADTDERDLAIVRRIVQLMNRPTRDELVAHVKKHKLKIDIADSGDRSQLEILTQVAAEYDLSIDAVTAIYYTLTGPPKARTEVL